MVANGDDYSWSQTVHTSTAFFVCPTFGWLKSLDLKPTEFIE